MTGQRELPRDRRFDRTADAIRRARNDADARRALDALIRVSTAATGFCAARGYDAGQVTAGTAATPPVHRAVHGDGSLGSGIVNAAGTTIGVARIGVFSPQGCRSLCERAIADAEIAFDKPCGATCDRVLTHAHALARAG